MTNKVEAYYNENALAEWKRLERHPMEFNLTMRAFREYLPEKARILDIGGGPGRYAIELAKLGHRVTLLDLAQENVEMARIKAREMGATLEDFIHGNALDLQGLEEEAYDAILLLGPLYHLTSPEQQAKAIAQAAARLKSGGVIYAAVITRFAFLLDMLKYDLEGLAEREEELFELLAQGVNQGEAGFTEAYFSRPEELPELMTAKGFQCLRYMAADGITTLVEPAINQLSPPHFDAWARLCWELSTEPSLLGACEHLLYIGKKP